MDRGLLCVYTRLPRKEGAMSNRMLTEAGYWYDAEYLIERAREGERMLFTDAEWDTYVLMSAVLGFPTGGDEDE